MLFCTFIASLYKLYKIYKKKRFNID